MDYLSELKYKADSESFAWNQKHDRQVVFAEGKAEGIVENSTKIARQMKADGMPTEIIAKYTGLTSDEIEKL